MMVDYQIPTNFTSPLLANTGHLRDSASNISGDESVFPASTLSIRSDLESSSDITSLLLTARSTSPTTLLDGSGFHASISDKDASWETVDLEKSIKHSDTDVAPLGTTVNSQRSRTPSPGISKMLLSLSDHPVERPCSPSASSLYRNTKTHCNPSELGQRTYDECMNFTRWANTFLQHSQDQFLITDLVRDLGDGITLLSLVEMLVGECPPQIHIKPALDVQKMENIQTCLDFLEYYGVSLNGITADDIVKGNFKVVLALCHSLHRHFGSSAVTHPQSSHLVDDDELSLFGWVSKVTGKQVVNFQSFQDGTVLCLLLNKIIEGVIPNLVLEFGSAVEKLSLALKVSSEQLGVVTGLQAESIMSQKCRENFMEYLKSLYRVYVNKSKKVYDSFEQRSLRRELKRQLIREQRLQSERYGSELTYLGDLSQDKSRIAREKLQISLANAPKGVSNNESFKSTRRLESHENDELKPVTNGLQNVSRNGILNNTKKQLDELKKELELLKLELSEDGDEKRCDKSYSGRHSLSQGNSTRGLEETSAQRRQTNPRLELRDVYRDRTSASMSGSTQRTFHNGDAPTEKTEKAFAADSDFAAYSGESKPLFGKCYLGKIPSSFDNSSSRGIDHLYDELSFTSKETEKQPRSSIRDVTRTFPLQDFPEPVFPSQSGSELFHVKPYTLESKDISNLFDVDFGDVGNEKPGGARENLVLRRMLRAGSQGKLQGSKARDDLYSVHSFSQGNYKVNGEAKTSLVRPYGQKDKGEVLDKSFGILPSTKSIQRKQIVPVMDKLSVDQHVKDSTEQPRALQRTLSKEKRHREQVLAKKSARSTQPPSRKTHLHALTALIRMSAKSASAVCDEEAQ